MKKKLEAELISIAHRILKIKDKSDIEILHKESQKLFEKLSVLRFLEENFEGVKPTIGRFEVESKFDTGFDYKSAEEPVTEAAQSKGTIVHSAVEKTPEPAEEVEKVSDSVATQEAGLCSLVRPKN